MKTFLRSVRVVVAVTVALILATAGGAAAFFSVCPTVTCRMQTEGVKNTNIKTEIDQLMAYIDELVKYMNWFSGGSSFLQRLSSLPSPDGFGKVDGAAAEREIAAASGSWKAPSGVDLRWRGITDAPGARVYEAAKASSAAGKTMSPGIIPADFQSLLDAVMTGLISEGNTSSARSGISGVASLSILKGDTDSSADSASPGGVSARAMEAGWGFKVDQLAAFIAIHASGSKDDSERREEKERLKTTVEKLPLPSELMGPSETIKRIVADLSGIMTLRAESGIAMTKIVDMRARRALVLARLAAMEGDTMAGGLFRAMNERARYVDNLFFMHSTNTGSSGGGEAEAK